ncbi:hypothetical protein DP107_05475 [Haloglomus irregulare]|jgi:hypothetical protein|uniref:RecA-superfamily ATPase, KaiC/GvpD/RAD55 family n=1 Tax=Haloglomus irregulare TaxID=2234134 RepID=A0A554ND33_9EURY|nr:hypothetical protein [Haloglomus irregulare]TSD15299.1 hypothetical protein DP107_05475 [Haloglomus irregulare]
MPEFAHLADVPSALSGAAAVLVRAPGLHGRREGLCPTLSLAGTPTSTVAVTYCGTAEEWLTRMAGHRATLDAIRVVTVGAAVEGDDVSGPTVLRVETPDDLTGVEIAVGEGLSALPDGHATLCLDSLTALLQYADVEEAYRLLHPLVERLHADRVVGHFHVDPAAHEPETLATLAGVFDAEVTLTGDTVRSGPRAASVRTTARAEKSGFVKR